MSDFTIRDSLSVQFTKAPAIAIAGASGSGKTESAMRVARGWCNHFGPREKFVVLDTEEKRALYKKARHQPWDWLDFQPPFSPERTWQALDAVKHYRAVILDSASHEYAGEGSISEIADEELERMSKGDPARMEALVAPAWKNAKKRHKRELMWKLIRYPTLIICCLRAEPKVKFVKVEKNGRMVNSIVDGGYQPICEKMFMYEMLASFMMYAENAGVPQQVKALEEDLKPVFLDGQKIDEATGERLARWAEDRARVAAQTVAAAPAASEPDYITPDQVAILETLCQDNRIPVETLKRAAQVETLQKILASDYDPALTWINKKIARAGAPTAQ